VQVADEDETGPVEWLHDGSGAVLLRIDGSPPLLSMEGRAIYRWATTALPDVARRACARAGIRPEELGGFVPHQANVRIIDSIVRQLKLPPSVAVSRDIVDSANTSAASVPLALTRLVESGEVRRGDPVLLLGFGAGLTAAGQVVRAP
jgi:3-oxoacyl-[acyl-carrier-protein] synthase-3